MHNVSISVIIPVYNRSNELYITLRSLTQQTLSKECFEVIISDDGSSEDIKAVLKDFPELRLKYVHQPDEGFRVAAARNLGADQASGRILVFSDNGMVLSSTNLEKHIARHNADGESFVALGNMLATGSSVNQDRVRELLETNSPDDAITILKDENMRDGREYMLTNYGEKVDSWYVPWQASWGGHLSVNSAFVKKHNIRWNESFTFWGGEDIEYGIQLCDANACLCFCHDVMAVHYPTPSSNVLIKPGSDEWKEVQRQYRQHLIHLYPNRREIEAWSELGGRINLPEKRKEFFSQKGWEL